MKAPILEIYGSSDIGKVRTNNEDFFVSQPRWRFFLVADGMGGHNAGEVAARVAADDLSKLTSKFFFRPQIPLLPEHIISYLRFSIRNANRHIYDLSLTQQHLKGMGTTICCLSLYGETAVFAHVGDSRIYHFREKLSRLTQDHSLANKLFTTGNKQSLPSSYKGIITKALGTSSFTEPDINICPINKDDLFLLCTDGLSDFVSDERIEITLHKTPSLKKACKRLIQMAKEKGGHDNITVLLVRVVSFAESNL
jgi:PPM family protein phosphatase